MIIRRYRYENLFNRRYESQTVEWEVREEVRIRVKCKDLLFVIEGVHGMNFYDGKEYMKYIGNEEIGDLECLE